MHFSTIFTTALALPLLSMAAPTANAAAEGASSDLVARQNGQTCDQFQFLAAGRITIQNNLRESIKAFTKNGDSWVAYDFMPETIAAGGQMTYQVNSNSNGKIQIKWCDAKTGTSCIYPSGLVGSDSRTFELRNSGDRWPVTIALNNADKSWVGSTCFIGTKI